MKRKILFLNVVLAIGLIACLYVLVQRYQSAERRNAEILTRASRGPAAKAIELKNAAEPPLRAASYFEVAEKMLFSKDRNPTVIVEVAQEKPMPPLPAAFGVMDLGSGPVAFLARKDETQHGYKIGESIGEFKLVAASSSEITFEWEGKQVTRRLEELRAQAKESGQQPIIAAQPMNAPAAPSTAGRPAEPKLGTDLSPTSKYCVEGDTSPEGTVLDGYRKVTRKTPFSTTCTWEKVQ